MSRQSRTHLSVLLSILVGLCGCHPTQPFYAHEDGDLSHYLDHVTAVEYPDVEVASLAEVTDAKAPFTLSDPEPEEIWDLTLEEVVSIALKNSKVIRNLGGVTQFGFAGALVDRIGGSTTVYDTAIVETDPVNGVEAALSAFDAQLSILGSNNGNLHTQTDRPSTFQGGAVILRENGGLRTELAKRAATGTQFFLRNQTDYTRGDNLIGFGQPVNSVWETLFELEVRQPLLRGRGTQVNRIPVMLARINTDITLASFEAGVRNLVLDIENTYWDLYLAYRNLQTAKTGRDSAQVTWKTVYERFEGGVADVQEEAQSREQYFFFRAALEQSLRDLYDTESRLRFLMGLASADGRLIRPIDDPTAARIEFDWRAINNEAIARSAELRQQKWAIKRRELELIAARNQLLPQLDAGITYRWYGIGDHLINADRNGIDFVPTNQIGNTSTGVNVQGNLFRDPFDARGPVGSNAFDVLTNGHYQEAAFFLSFQMPVGFRGELSGVRNAQLNLAREHARLEDIELNASHLLASAVRSLDFSYRNAETQFNRWKASSREVESVVARFKGGKITLDLVLEAQRRRAQSEADYSLAVINYNKALAEVHYRKGSLLEYNNIYLAEGPWPEKAYWDALEKARERDSSYYMNYGWTRPSVISEGPTPQMMGEPARVVDEPIEANQGGSSPEVIPPPQPTPAQPDEAATSQPAAEEETPSEPAPITNLPDGPTLNAPRRAETRTQRDRVAADSSEPKFQWGNMGLDIPPRDGSNPVQQATHEQ